MNGTCSPIESCVRHHSGPAESLAVTAAACRLLWNKRSGTFWPPRINLGDIEVQIEATKPGTLARGGGKGSTKEGHLTPPVCPVCQKPLSQIAGDSPSEF